MSQCDSEPAEMVRVADQSDCKAVTAAQVAEVIDRAIADKASAADALIKEFDIRPRQK